MKTLYPRASQLFLGLALATAAVEVLIDWITPIRLNISIIYSVPLILAGLGRNRRLLWLLLIALLCMTFAVYAVQVGGSPLTSEWPLQNRVLSAVTMLLTATLLHMWTHALDALEERDLQIRQQNEDLERRRGQAQKASQQKTLLLASLSHDIRTPLSVIGLTAHAISSEVSNRESTGVIATLTRRLLANTNSLTSQVADILDFSTLEMGHVEVHAAGCVLGDLLDQLQRNLLPMAQAKGLALLIDPQAEPICLRTDPVKLERVLTNLVVNAIKYTDDGFVRVSAGHSDAGGICVRVDDTGVGIAPNDRERIFDEFARLNGSCDRSQSWGLGLPICRRLITLMKGTIKVEGQRGTGSAFIVLLPLTCDGQMPRGADILRAPWMQGSLSLSGLNSEVQQG